jgi:integrase
MSKNKYNFTKKYLEDLPIPAKGKRAYYYDIKARGLGIAITDKGTKTFVVYRKIDGKPERVTLGYFPEIAIESARKLSMEVNAQIARGKNPNKEKQKIQQGLTLNALFEQYIEKYAKNHKRSWAGDCSLYNCHLAELGERKISLIKKNDIELWYAKIGNEHGKYGANRTYSLLRTMFNKALDWGWEGVNPCIGFKKFKEKSRERFLHGDELPKFFKALNNELNETFRDFFYVCLLTGARRGNVLSMNWKSINLERGTWCIQETKNGESQTIPLAAEVMEILTLRLANKVNDWVFPSATSKSGHIEEPKKAWKRILKEAEIEDLRIHDLRRTLGSWQAATGANSFVIGKSLGHKTQAATAIYARLNLDPVRESVNKATSAMLAFTKDKK